MESIMESFSSNGEIEEFPPGDTSISLTGYIDAIEGLSKVSEETKTLFKIIVNNAQGKRVRVLFWNNLAKKYTKTIFLHDIIRIKKGVTRPAFSKYANSMAGIHDLEVSGGNDTIITIDGSYKIEDQILEIEKVELKHLNKFKKSLFRSEVYIKEIFTSNKSMSGSGVVTDGFYRVRVQILDFNDSKCSFEEGDHIEIEGEARRDKYGLIVIYLKNLDAIKKTFKEPLSIKELRLGYRMLKRLPSPLESYDEVPPTKSIKID